jgi:hypothetical protein
MLDREVAALASALRVQDAKRTERRLEHLLQSGPRGMEPPTTCCRINDDADRHAHPLTRIEP